MSSAVPGELGAFVRQPDNLNHLTGGKFHLNIMRLPNTVYFCRSVTIPGINTTPAMQSTPFVDLPYAGDKPEFQEFEIEFMVDEDLGNYKEMYNWLLELTFPKSREEDYRPIATRKKEDLRPNFGDLFSDATLHILTNSSNYNININYRDLFPVNLTSAVLTNSDSDVMPVTATVLFRYMYYDIEVVT